MAPFDSAAQHAGGELVVSKGKEAETSKLKDVGYRQIVAAAKFGIQYIFFKGYQIYVEYDDAESFEVPLDLTQPHHVFIQQPKSSDKVIYEDCLLFTYDDKEYVSVVRRPWPQEEADTYDRSDPVKRFAMERFLVKGNKEIEKLDSNCEETESRTLSNLSTLIKAELSKPQIGMPGNEVKIMDYITTSCTGEIKESCDAVLGKIADSDFCTNGNQFWMCSRINDVFQTHSRDLLTMVDDGGHLLAIVKKEDANNPNAAYTLTTDSLTRWTTVKENTIGGVAPVLVKPHYVHGKVEIPVAVQEGGDGRLQLRAPGGDFVNSLMTRFDCVTSENEPQSKIPDLTSVKWQPFVLWIETTGGSKEAAGGWELYSSKKPEDGLKLGDMGEVSASTVMLLFGNDSGKIQFSARSGDPSRFVGYKSVQIEIDQDQLCSGKPVSRSLESETILLSAALFKGVSPVAAVELKDSQSVALTDDEIKVEVPELQGFQFGTKMEKMAGSWKLARPLKAWQTRLDGLRRALEKPTDIGRCVALRELFEAGTGASIYAPGEKRIAVRESDRPETVRLAERIENTKYFDVGGSPANLEIWMEDQWQSFNARLACDFKGSGVRTAYVVFDTDDFSVGSRPVDPDCADPGLSELERLLFECKEPGPSSGGSRFTVSDEERMGEMWGRCAYQARNFLSQLGVEEVTFVHAHPNREGGAEFSDLYVASGIGGDSAARKFLNVRKQLSRAVVEQTSPTYDYGNEAASAEALAQSFLSARDRDIPPFSVFVLFSDPHSGEAGVKEFKMDRRLVRWFVVGGFLGGGDCALRQSDVKGEER